MLILDSVPIPERNMLFRRWSGVPINHTFGNKGLIDIDGKPMFAELAIAETMKRDGYETRWVEVYGRGNKEPIYLTQWKDAPYKDQVNVPIQERWITDTLAGIAKLNNNSYKGCWDVIAWRNDKLLFVESKRKKRDSVRGSQIAWLEACLKYGLTPENFLILQWDFEDARPQPSLSQPDARPI